MDEIVKHINDTNASYRSLTAGNAKNTDLFLDNEHYEFFKDAGEQITVRFDKENLSKAILFIASILPRKYDHSSIHKKIPYSETFVFDQIAFLNAFFMIDGKPVEKRTQKWSVRKDVLKANGEIDNRFYFNDLLTDVKYTGYNGDIKTAKFSIRNYLAGGFSDIHIKKAENEVFDVWVTNTQTPYDDGRDSDYEVLSKREVNKCDLNYLAAIKTKPFLILGGFSGTGKSQKVKELAFLTCPNDDEMGKKLGNTENTPGNYCLVSVRPNWHDSTDLLGYYSSINDKYIVTDFVRFLVKAMQYPEIPFFVCLDEMNLAPVEEYFAEYLSVLESRKKVGKEIKTDPLVSCDWFKKDYKEFNIFDELGLLRVGRTQSTGENRQASIFGDTDDDAFVRLDIVAQLKKHGLCLPSNVVVVGTVNMDDTTNSFSRKVIDRAMTFETIVEEFDNKYYEAEDTMTYGGSKVGDWTWILPDEVRANEAIEHTPNLLDENQKTEVTKFINEVNTCLKGSPFQIAYRILNETILYYRATKIVNKDEADLNKVFDDVLMQKVLPRIEGDYDKTFKSLTALKTKAETKGWTKSKEKIDFMLGRFSKDDQGGFTSFWN